MHPLLHPERRIAPCIIVCQISQLSPHALIQSMRASFCIYRLINRQNSVYNRQIRAVDARNGWLGVILPDRGFRSPALFNLRMTAFRDRNQRFIMECTLLWTIAGYRPQCEASSEVSRICLFAGQIVNISRQGLIYIPAMFVLGAIFHETVLIWAQPVADVLSLLLAAGLYFRISSKAQNSAVLPPQE